MPENTNTDTNLSHILKERLCALKCLNALDLKVIAMALMLCDHLWGTVAAKYTWLTAIGRIAFPIFAFQIVEGFFRTSDFRKYLKRMFTFCLSLLLMAALEKARKKGKAVFVLASVGIAALSFVLGFVTFVDYYGYGIWMVLLFYFCRNLPYGWLGELAGLIYINWHMIGGLVYLVPRSGGRGRSPSRGWRCWR